MKPNYLLNLLVLVLASAQTLGCDSGDGDLGRGSGAPGDGSSSGGSGTSGSTGVDADSDGVIDGSTCANTLHAVIRDFTSSHPDFERPDLGWGPAQGMVMPNLDANSKPVFAKLYGDFQMQDPNCGRTCPLGGFLSQSTPNPIGDSWASPPMWTDAATFAQWYTDVPNVNTRVEKDLIMVPSGNNSYIYDNPAFFPIDNEGFGPEPGQYDDLGVNHNFLFTTEVAVMFNYQTGQKFTFRGDDDLWIFVNGHLALDLGGLHWPYEGTIDFDAQATALGIVPGNDYPMNIFHAERHSTQSNFRVETNIACFTNIIID